MNRYLLYLQLYRYGTGTGTVGVSRRPKKACCAKKYHNHQTDRTSSVFWRAARKLLSDLSISMQLQSAHAERRTLCRFMRLPTCTLVSIFIFLLATMSSAKTEPKTSAFVPKKSVDAAADSSPSAAHPLALSADLNAIINKDLMNDIEMLSSMLSSIVKRENSRVYDLYTQLRKHGIDRASDPDNTDAFEAMKKLSFDISPHDALGVMRVFSVALNLVNAAEVHHRLRVMRQMEMKASKNNENVGPLPMVEDSVRGSFDIILAEGTSKEEVYEKLISQKVEIVLTAHPTEGE